MVVGKPDWKKTVYGLKYPVFEWSSKSHDCSIWIPDPHTVGYSDLSGIQVFNIQIVTVVWLFASNFQVKWARTKASSSNSSASDCKMKTGNWWETLVVCLSVRCSTFIGPLFIDSWFSIQSGSSLRLWSQMKRLRGDRASNMSSIQWGSEKQMCMVFRSWTFGYHWIVRYSNGVLKSEHNCLPFRSWLE